MKPAIRALPTIGLLLSACVLFHDTEVRLPTDGGTDADGDSGTNDMGPEVADLLDAHDLALGALCGQDRHCASGNCSNSHCAPDGLAYLPAGTFTMGSPDGITADPISLEFRPAEPGRATEERLHRVVLNRSVFMQAHEVTQGEWLELFETNPSEDDTCGEDCPVESVTWWEALVYANALSEAGELEKCYSLAGCNGQPGSGMICTSVTFHGLDCQGYRLATEAEWEYAARAGTTTAYSNGDSDDDHLLCEIPFLLTEVAWYCGNAAGGVHEVETRDANPWELHDLNGNVLEWVWDRYDPAYYSSSDLEDPLGPQVGTNRGARGGSWVSLASQCRSASRLGGDPGSRFNYLGFRLVRTAAEPD